MNDNVILTKSLVPLQILEFYGILWTHNCLHDEDLDIFATLIKVCWAIWQCFESLGGKICVPNATEPLWETKGNSMLDILKEENRFNLSKYHTGRDI